jgi:hypothetical protein
VIARTTVLALVISWPVLALSQPPRLSSSEHEYSVAAVFSRATEYDEDVELSAGTGFLVSPDGHILTALHVVGDPDIYERISIKVVFPVRTGQRTWTSTKPLDAHIKDWLPEYDLALIELDDVAYASRLPVIGFDFEETVVGNDGFSGYGFNLVRSADKVRQPSSIRGTFQRMSDVRPFAEVAPLGFAFGSSGGPLFDGSSRVFAAWHGSIRGAEDISGALREVSGIAWVIPMDRQVRAWLRKNGVEPRVRPSAREGLPFRSERGTTAIVVDPAQLRRRFPRNTSSSELFIPAPMYSRIERAVLIEPKTWMDCGALSICSAPGTPGVAELEIDSGVNAIVSEPPLAGSMAVIFLRRDLWTPELSIREVSVLLVKDMKSATIEALPGSNILAVSFVGDLGTGGDQSMVSLAGGDLAIRRVPDSIVGATISSRSMLVPVSSMTTGVFLVLEAPVGLSIDSAEAKSVLTEATSEITKLREPLPLPYIKLAKPIRLFHNRIDP